MKFAFALCLLGTVMAGPLSLKRSNPLYCSELNKNKIVPLVIGGNDAKDGQVPYQVSLLDENIKHFCGGSIIADEWILTAAHCVDGIESANKLSIRYNSLKYNKGGQIVKASKLFLHPNYNAKNQDNDVALIRLVSKLTLGQENADKIKLPSQGSVPSGYVAASGWGNMIPSYFIHVFPKTLQVVTVPIVEQSICRKEFGKKTKITDAMFCAGFPQGGKDTCQGDSGGPVADASCNLVGIVSWGEGCAQPHKPGVYTNVGMFIDWIKSNNVPI